MPGRNTTIIRSNYGLPGTIGFYELSMKLWERMEQDPQLCKRLWVSQRGVINLYHFRRAARRLCARGNTMRAHQRHHDASCSTSPRSRRDTVL
ncbi:hypothetical protein ACFSQT_31940 [Mesorhizobium calcicola]|uniref:Uncharacterized protein n=1 Tax=Mesorhizobium calcicola TaxID=1300310 RepID=A0ABW4WLX2_9HYPH